jgi:hypothetical protein
MFANLNPTAPSPAIGLDISPMSPAFAAWWQHRLSILSDGPSNSGEWWLYEFMQFYSGSPGFTTISFDVSALWLAFSLLGTRVPTRTTLFPDIFDLITILPLRSGEMVEKKLLLDLLLAAGRELKMYWWREPKERMVVFWGIMLAGLVLHRVGSGTTREDEELVSLMGQVDLSIAEDAKIIEELEVTWKRSLMIERWDDEDER